MALKKRGKWWYGDVRSDIRTELARYGNVTQYVPTHFADACCTCGSITFRLRLDDEEGAAVRICSKCSLAHPIGDSNEFLEDAEMVDCDCDCGQDVFKVTIGVALYSDSEDVKWLFVGCRCPSCGLVGCYGDWKNEFPDYRKLLALV